MVKQLLSFLLLIIIVLASMCDLANANVLVSDAGVEYDKEIQFFFKEWVPVIVEVKDFSNITIDYKNDPAEIQEAKDNEKRDIYKETMNSVLSTLSDEEFQLKRESEWGTFFSGNITKKGFDKLLNDQRVKKIQDNSIKAHLNLTIITKDLPKYIITLLLFLILVLIVSIFKLKRRNRKLKRQL
ncbi:MAG: hypothetical protein ABIH25_01225 [Candidatus Woesearchaeota archaeon]